MEPNKEDREELTTYEHMLATDSDDDLVVTNDAIADSASVVDDTLYLILPQSVSQC